jgi:DNA-binding FadR family transcriptional regulator
MTATLGVPTVASGMTQFPRRQAHRLTQLSSTAWTEEFIEMQVMTARVACGRITPSALLVLGESVQRAAGLPSRPGWEHKAVAHAETFRLLADVAARHGVATGADSTHRVMRDLMIMVGPAANGMILGSRRRLLAHLRAQDADGAGGEMEDHLNVLHYMWRLARPDHTVRVRAVHPAWGEPG